MKSVSNHKRAANYTKEECWRLIEIVEQYAHIIENKKTDALTWKAKKTAWQDVSKTFNLTSRCIDTPNRTWEQLRSKYEQLKKETRRAAAKNQNSVSGPDGCPCEEKVNHLYEKIRNLIKLTWITDGMPSLFDSDRLDEPQKLIVVQKLNDDEISVPSTPIPIDTESSTSFPITENNVEVKEENPEVTDWNDYSFVQIRETESPALQRRKRNRQATDLSTARRKMQPWLDAKAKLTNLKCKLLEEEFSAKQQREREIHEQQRQINDLTIKKLQVEIEILEKKRGNF